MFAYEDEYNFALSLVKEASCLFTPAYNSHKNIETKESSSDLVTETDKAIEDLISSKVKEKYPEHGFIGEETVSADGKIVFDDRPTWIVDPIDGTMNFVHCYPHTCIVIGFTVLKTVQFGVIYNPVLDQLFTGRLGFGAQLNGCNTEVVLALLTWVKEGVK
ncbi:inositol monophosphatase 1-like [Bolinopsis microptera]|uniref:inositol monophosphatase 1-like n=1 Tax=Bolinopsis microptera TaxID=2820187 RepID=UPI00307A76FE